MTTLGPIYAGSSADDGSVPLNPWVDDTAAAGAPDDTGALADFFGPALFSNLEAIDYTGGDYGEATGTEAATAITARIRAIGGPDANVATVSMRLWVGGVAKGAAVALTNQVFGTGGYDDYDFEIDLSAAGLTVADFEDAHTTKLVLSIAGPDETPVLVAVDAIYIAELEYEEAEEEDASAVSRLDRTNGRTTRHFRI